jgi:hypothetical protein
MPRSFNNFKVELHEEMKFIFFKKNALSETGIILWGMFPMNGIIMITKETPKDAIMDLLK